MGSTLAPMCESRYPVHVVAVDTKSTRKIVDQAVSVPKCVRLARMSEKSYELICKIFAAASGRTKDELEPILGKKLMGYASGNFSNFERHKQRGSTATDYHAVDENNEIHRAMMEVEPLLEAPQKRNWRSIMLTHGGYPCLCFFTNMVVSRAKQSCVDLRLWRAALHGFTRLITAHNDSEKWSYDGNSMAGSSCEGEQSTRDTNQRIIGGSGLSKWFKYF